MEEALLRLFNSVLVKQKTNQEIPNSVLERTIRNGYILSPEIEPAEQLLTQIENIVGLSGEKANSAFHKSWTVIQDAPLQQLVVQQIIHYFTTYGFESLGIYHKDTVYIPPEVLELPEINDQIPLVVIKAMTEEEVLDAILQLGSGIALSQDSLDDLMSIIEKIKYESGFVKNIRNRELKALLNDYYGIVPDEPVEFLRHLVSKLTDTSLLIKNKTLIEKIKKSNGKFLDELIKDAPEDLASIFFRFKPLFLAMKSISRNKTFFNQLRKEAETKHKPLPEDFLNSITSKIKNSKLRLSELENRLDKASIFRKIRLAYALKFRLNAKDSIVYHIRNGRGWATDFEWSGDDRLTGEALDIVIKSIVNDLKKNVQDKTIFIPDNISYTLPATEKQFTGNIPNGSYVTVPEDLIVGIHWTNTKRRIDLDLSLISVNWKFGWDAEYRSEDRAVLFSGDVTDAPPPHGASELFYIKKGEDNVKMLMVNYYNFNKDDEVKCKILAASEKAKKFGNNYMVDISTIVASADITISQKQNILGLITYNEGENRVYFANVSVGNSISSRNSKVSNQSRNYLINKLINSIKLEDLLTQAGAIVVHQKPDNDFVDLSPEALDKTTFLDLINPAREVKPVSSV